MSFCGEDQFADPLPQIIRRVQTLSSKLRAPFLIVTPTRIVNDIVKPNRELKRHGIFRLKPGPLEFLQALVNVL